MKLTIAIGVAVASLGIARSARVALTGLDREAEVAPPFTPTPERAPLVSLGYREAAADVLFVRLRAYFGAYYGTKADAIASLGEAIIALDPRFHRAYEYSANAMTVVPGADQTILERAVALLERGIAEFPKDWSLPMLAGQLYIQDLKTTDPAQRRAWDERGTLLVESAIRKPGAPQQLAIWAAHLRTKLGEHERAAQGIRELLLTTPNQRLRAALLQRLAEIEEADSAELAGEVLGARRAFERAWLSERPSVNASLYIVLGPLRPPGFDLADLAMGGRDLVIAEAPEQLEPIE